MESKIWHKWTYQTPVPETETDSQTYRRDLWLPRGRGRGKGWIGSLRLADAQYYLCVEGTHFAVHQKLTQHCKSTLCVCVCVCVHVPSVVSNSLQHHGLQPARLLCLWKFPGTSTGVKSRYLLHGSSWLRDWTRVSLIAGRFFTVWVTRETYEVKVSVIHLCSTLCDPIDCWPPGFSGHSILQARILEWVAIPFSRGSSQPRNWILFSYVSCIGRWILLSLCHLESPKSIILW